MKKYILVLILFLAVVSAVGCTETENKENTVSSPESTSQGQASLQQPPENIYKDAEWAKNVTEMTEVLINDANDISKAIDNSDWYTTFANIDKYKLDISNAITSSDSLTVSPELQPCKDEYKLALIDDYNAEVVLRTAINFLNSGDFASSMEASEEAADNFRSANLHYDNVIYLLESYNKDHQSAPLNLLTQYHTLTQEDEQSTANAPTQTNEPKVKTLADKEPEDEESVDNTDTSESTTSGDSSTYNIFDYCTWQAETTKNIGDYYKAPENKIYVIVTVKIDNTGDQTYSTNPNYWHLKIGDMYYQYDSSTFDSSLNHMTADIGPNGKITTKIVYLVDGNPSISDLDLYYDGPGSDGTIYS